MAGNLGQLTLDIVARIGGFTGPLDQAARQSKKTADDISQNIGKLKSVFMNIFPAAAAAASVAGITAFVKSTIDAADHMEKLSQSAGVSVETLSTMGYAAKFSGIDIEKLADGYKKLSKSMSETASGTGEAKKAFDVLGISVKNSDGSLKSSEQVMLELADKFAGMEDGAGKTALAMKFFGKSGADLIPMLNEGSAGLAEFAQKARDSGNALSTKAAAAAAEFNDKLDELAGKLKGTVLPYVQDFVVGVNAAFNAVKRSNWEELDDAEAKLKKLVDLKNAVVQGDKFDILKNLASARRAGLSSEAGSFWEFASQGKDAVAALNEEIKKTHDSIDKLHKDLTHPPTLPKKNAPVLPDDEDEKEAKRLTEAIDKQIAAIAEQGATFNMTSTEATLYKLAMQGANEGQIALARELLVMNEAQKKQAEEFEDSQKKVVAAAAATKKIFEDTRTPIEQYNARMKELDDFLNDGAISFETYTRAAEGAEKTFTDAVTKTADKGNSKLDELKDAIEGWGRSSADAFAEFAMSGKASFTDLANSIIQDILRMTAYQQIFKPMFGAISSGVSNLFGTPTPTVPLAHGNVFKGGNIIPFAKGGIIDRPVTFPLGLAGEAGLEAILPLKRTSGGDLGVKADMRGMGGGPMKIEIINKSGQPMEVTDAKFNLQDQVLSVWIDGFNRNKGGLRTLLGG